MLAEAFKGMGGVEGWVRQSSSVYGDPVASGGHLCISTSTGVARTQPNVLEALQKIFALTS